MIVKSAAKIMIFYIYFSICSQGFLLKKWPGNEKKNNVQVYEIDQAENRKHFPVYSVTGKKAKHFE